MNPVTVFDNTLYISDFLIKYVFLLKIRKNNGCLRYLLFCYNINYLILLFYMF